MKKIIIMPLVALMFSACTAIADPELRSFDYGPDVKPIQGSLTFGDRRGRKSRLQAGDRFTHEFYDRFGSRVTERYRVLDDGTLQLFSRRISPVNVR